MAQSYEELKAKLLQEFRFCLTLEQVYARLQSHRWDGSLPVELFVEEILTLAKKAGIPEGETVHIIIDHFSSHGPDVHSCLSAATTAGELKTLVRMRRHLLFSPTVRHPRTSRSVISRQPSCWPYITRLCCPWSDGDPLFQFLIYGWTHKTQLSIPAPPEGLLLQVLADGPSTPRLS